MNKKMDGKKWQEGKIKNEDKWDGCKVRRTGMSLGQKPPKTMKNRMIKKELKRVGITSRRRVEIICFCSTEGVGGGWEKLREDPFRNPLFI